MEENVAMKKGKMLENLIGILLIMPIYMVILVGFNLKGDNRILFPTLMYVPIIIGMVLAYKNYNGKISKTIGNCILFFLIVALYFYYQTYFINHPGWDSVGYMMFWLISTAILKIFSCIFYGKIVGRHKAIMFLLIYVLVVGASFALGFWA